MYHAMVSVRPLSIPIPYIDFVSAAMRKRLESLSPQEKAQEKAKEVAKPLWSRAAKVLKGQKERIDELSQQDRLQVLQVGR